MRANNVDCHLRPDAKREGLPMISANPIGLHPSATKWLTALVIGVVALYVIFFILFFSQSGPRDGDQFLVFHSLQYWNAALFGIAKQWTPLMCSGLSLAGEPQVPFMSLSMALSYLWGPLWGVRSSTAIYLALGWWGAYLYAGLWLRIPLQRALAASLFIGNGFFFCRLGFGHFDFIPFLILPSFLWALHRVTDWSREQLSVSRVLRTLLTVLALGGTVALVIDGSPVAIIHLLLWIGLYAVMLAIRLRRVTPALIFGLAVVIAGGLDAGYLWPMLQSQQFFPRLTLNHFTSVLSLFWFAILPLRGKVLPANGNGHELSVYVGPILVYSMWRYRHWLAANMPGEMSRPQLVVSLASIILGMGSLKALHIPTWLSPFDLLRPFPGFRSLGVTGRYWGFLALPLSLMSAGTLWKLAADLRSGWRLHLCFLSVLIFQLGFQAETLTRPWLHSPQFSTASLAASFQHGPEIIEYVAIADDRLQGEVLTPTRGVCNCYDMDDFNRAANGPGSTLITSIVVAGKASAVAPRLDAHFVTWSHIRLRASCAIGSGSVCELSPSERIDQNISIKSSTRIVITLSQAYHRGWTTSACSTLPGNRGNLVLDCPAASVLAAPLDVLFDDPASDRGTRVSLTLWRTWLYATAALLAVWVRLVRSARRTATPAASGYSEG